MFQQDHLLAVQLDVVAKVTSLERSYDPGRSGRFRSCEVNKETLLYHLRPFVVSVPIMRTCVFARKDVDRPEKSDSVLLEQTQTIRVNLIES